MDLTGIEALPDYAALRQIQNALWKIGEVHGAGVMIGAGFSRFADLAAETTPRPPLWSDFHKEMLDTLYPGGHGPADPLVLAEEYRAALGEQALENLICGRVRDTEWTPGALHRRLLQLPWADILTTNWDTLLERSAASDPDISYDVVRIVSDIARARRPRIVKLHGSMPSHRPFIFSEEDFRTYPQHFAPFVNLAQQVLLENELCLLGFSGDDPNFLEWAGWVRDKLGPSARPIRLVGVLNLSSSRRRLLERRNITPIDLATLVSDVPPEDRHRRATELFLESLWQARPKTNVEWKRSREKDYAIKKLADAEARLTRLAKVWAEDRSNHPGWLVTPSLVREVARYDTNESIRLLAADLDKVTAPVRATVLYETVWRWETFFWPLPDFVEKTIAITVAAGDDLSLSEERRILLRAAIVRAARRKRDWRAFDERIEWLEQVTSADAKTEAMYERCLRAREELNYEFIASNCSKLTGNDPVWFLRRAALMAEFPDGQMAARTILQGYEEIRRRRAQDRRGLWLLSREAWASWLMNSARFELDHIRGRDDGPDWPFVYKVAETDPWDELHRLDRAIDKADVAQRNASREREPLFDAGTYRIRSRGPHGMGGAAPSPYDDLIHLSEKVGIPLKLGSVNLLEERFARAIEIDQDDSIISAWASLRAITSYDRGLINISFSRIAVARLPIEAVEDMAARLRGAIAFGHVRTMTVKEDGSSGQHGGWVSRIRALTEVLSRLSVRFSDDVALDLFRFGASLAHSPALKHWWFFEAIGNLLRRSLQAVEPSRRGEAALDVLSLPLPCEKEILGPERDFPEISDCLDRQGWRAREYTHAWSSRIAFLTNVVAENKHKLSREYAALRLLKLFEAGALSESEARAFGEALWQHADNEGLPADTNLLPHVFMELPCPDPALPRRVFEAAVVKKLAAGAFTSDLLTSVLGASYTLQARYVPYRLNADDALAILDHALKWERRAPNPGLIFSGVEADNERLADSIGGALASTVLPSLTAVMIGSARCRSIFDRIFDRTLPALLQALPALIRLDESQSDEANKAIRNGLLSQESRVVVSALSAIFWLARFAREGGRPVPPFLATEAVSLCLLRREPGLISALRTVRWLVLAGSITVEERHRLIEALELIRTETAYENWEDEVRRSDVGLIRGAALKLAMALKDAGARAASMDEWIAQAAADPMPEVRYAGKGQDDSL